MLLFFIYFSSYSCPSCALPPPCPAPASPSPSSHTTHWPSRSSNDLRFPFPPSDLYVIVYMSLASPSTPPPYTCLHHNQTCTHTRHHRPLPSPPGPYRLNSSPPSPPSPSQPSKHHSSKSHDKGFPWWREDWLLCRLLYLWFLGQLYPCRLTHSSKLLIKARSVRALCQGSCFLALRL